jgi:hypothetical protein
MAFGKIWAGSRRLSLGQQIKTLQNLRRANIHWQRVSGKYIGQIHRTDTLMVYEKAVCRYETLVSTKRILMVIYISLGEIVV